MHWKHVCKVYGIDINEINQNTFNKILAQTARFPTAISASLQMRSGIYFAM